LPTAIYSYAVSQTGSRAGWESPSGSNIYYTLMLKPDFNADCAPMLTLVMALAVAKGIRQTLGRGSEEGAAKVGIKWPNDIVLDGKKVCGILTEMSMEQRKRTNLSFLKTWLMK
jgi:BirA family biotin operon repressor/biotin-[acetyl-CoA-carboxylase] ligase